MTHPSSIREITGKPVATRFHAGELAQFATLGISVSDTETTGLTRGVNGLTELASIRAEIGTNGKPRLMAFHQHVLPLKPAYRDYVAACAKAAAEGTSSPRYDREKHEYAVEPRALEVTGTELVRERLDGPITGLRVRGKDGKFETVKNAVPFYEVAEAFKEFTRSGDHDVYFNAPFDLPFLAEQLRDIAVDDMLRTEAYRHARTQADERLTPREQEALHSYGQPYDQLREHEKEALRSLLVKLVDVPRTYTNSALFRCLMYGNLAANGFKARNNLDTVYEPLRSEAEKERGDHSALEDVVMAARVALDQAKQTDGHIHTITELFDDLLHRVDPNGQVSDGPTRSHRTHKDKIVQGDVLLKFSNDPKKLGSDAESFWNFLLAFREVRNWSPRSPEHVLDIDEATHHVTINAEHKNPLSLSFLKKCAYFHQLLKAKSDAEAQGKHTVIQSIQPFDSTGTVMDVVLHKPDEVLKIPRRRSITPIQAQAAFARANPAAAGAMNPRIESLAAFEANQPPEEISLTQPGETRVVEAVPFTSLRANTAFLEAHPEKAEDYLKLIRHLTQCDQSVGTVLLSEASDGSTRITVKGHLRGFGECVLRVPPRADIAENIPTLTHELEIQLRLGAIPGVAGFEKPDEEDDGDAVEEDGKKSAQVKNPVAMEKYPDGHVSLALSANVFAAVAMRLNQKKQKHIPLGQDSSIATDHGPITVTYDTSDKDYPRYRLSGQMDALHDFVDLDHDPESAQAKEGKKPAALIRDASWLLYRLEQLPGTYHVRVDGHMAVLEQRDGVDAETLNMLYRLKIPFKAYAREIKLDLSQLMENAFHWSVELKRSSDERHKDAQKPVAQQKLNPPRLIEDLKGTLYSGNARALEMNEQQQFWLLDHSKAMHGQPQHHPILGKLEGVTLAFNDKKQLIIERSDIRRDDIAGNSDGRLTISLKRLEDGQSVLLSVPQTIEMLVARQLNLSPDSAQSGPLMIPIAQEPSAQQALDAALRYTYWLSKATGSERQVLRGIGADLANEQVSIRLPELSLLAGPNNGELLQKMHSALSQPELKILLKALRDGLPDVRFSSPRHADLYQLVSAVRPQIGALQRMHSLLDGLVSTHGAIGKDAMLPMKSLDAALDTLGLLLHEIASLRQAKGGETKPADAVFEAIAEAQEKLSNVVYGLQHLKEDIGVLNKSIIGSAAGNSRALLREQGDGMNGCAMPSQR
jgi:DNA polymerase III epsilon subunit-like protein